MSDRLLSNRLVSRPQVEGWPLIGLAVLIFGSILLAAFSQWQKQQDLPGPVIKTLAERSLIFADSRDGNIAVTDAITGERLPSIEGEAGFARGVLRSLAQARLRDGGGPETPFVLVRLSDGSLRLQDPWTQREVDLTTFGPSNVAVFQPLLEVRQTRTQQ
jgi:putative photosynthetic complex assembly protein